MEFVKRFIELGERKTYLEAFVKKLEEDNNCLGLMMFAQTFDKDISEKNIGQLFIMKAWVEEIDAEMKTIEPQILSEIWNVRVAKYIEELESAAKKAVDDGKYL